MAAFKEVVTQEMRNQAAAEDAENAEKVKKDITKKEMDELSAKAQKIFKEGKAKTEEKKTEEKKTEGQ